MKQLEVFYDHTSAYKALDLLEENGIYAEVVDATSKGIGSGYHPSFRLIVEDDKFQIAKSFLFVNKREIYHHNEGDDSNPIILPEKGLKRYFIQAAIITLLALFVAAFINKFLKFLA